MDNIRIILWATFIGLLWITYSTWQQQYPPEPLPTEAAESAAIPGEETMPALPELAPPAEDDSVPALPNLASETADRETPAIMADESVRVRTDVLDVRIAKRGGTLISAKTLEYPQNKDQPDVPVQLLAPGSPELYTLRSGLRAADERPEANHTVNFASAGQDFVLADGADELDVVLTWRSDDGIEVDKVYRFRRGRYDIGLTQVVRNSGGTPYRAASYLQLQRDHLPPERSMFNVDSYSYTGPVIYDGDKYEKLDVEDYEEAPLQQMIENGWVASIQHHFLTAAVPPANEEQTYQLVFDGKRYLMSSIGPLQTIAPDGEAEFMATFFVGPKLQSQLEETAKGLDLTVDYGVLALLAQPLFWLLEKIHSFVGNWGWAIIICTIVIKLVFYKLTEASGRSMAKMRKLQPRLKQLQERHKDDRQKMSQALMELYKKEKVNPAAGCLPMLIQIPFFIAFYWVLLESVEMRQAPFALWITDLSSRDPYFILPLLMGAAMFLQQKLNPAPPDPVQAKVMQILPLVFTVFFAFFPAGLVLYWLTNSVLSIAQQWRINKVVGAN